MIFNDPGQFVDSQTQQRKTDAKHHQNRQTWHSPDAAEVEHSTPGGFAEATNCHGFSPPPKTMDGFVKRLLTISFVP